MRERGDLDIESLAAEAPLSHQKKGTQIKADPKRGKGNVRHGLQNFHFGKQPRKIHGVADWLHMLLIVAS